MRSRHFPGLHGRVALWSTLFFLVVLVSLWSVPQSPVYAALDMGVTPSKFDLELGPGETSTQLVRVSNAGTERTHFRAYVMDWHLSQRGEFIAIPAGTGQRSASSWIVVSPAEFDLGPGEVQEVRVGIKVPQGVAGSYRSVVFFESAPAQVSRVFGVSIASRLGVMIYITIRGTAVKQGGIVDLAAEYEAGKGTIAGQIGFENTGNVHLTLKPTVELRDGEGRRVARTELPSAVSLPDSYLEIPFTWETKLPAGEYIMLVVIDYGGNSKVAGQIVFESP